MFPEYGVLDPDGWREPFELRFHQAAQRKKLEKGFRANCVTRASYNDLLSEVENLYDFLQITRKDVREVQERLAKAQVSFYSCFTFISLSLMRSKGLYITALCCS